MEIRWRGDRTASSWTNTCFNIIGRGIPNVWGCFETGKWTFWGLRLHSGKQHQIIFNFLIFEKRKAVFYGDMLASGYRSVRDGTSKTPEFWEVGELSKVPKKD